MKHSYTEKEGIVIISLEGDVVGGSDAGRLNKFIHDLVMENKTRLVVDLTGVKLMSSSGLGILIGALTTLRKAGGDLVLVNVKERIQNLLRITKLRNVFKTFGTIDEAIAGLR